jgi:hypothetical protein
LNKRTKTTVACIVLVLLAGIAAATSPSLYYVRGDSGGDVIWNADGAYVFVKTGERGFHTTILAYPWVALKQYFYAPPLADDERFSETVIRVTPSWSNIIVVDVPGNSPGNAPSLYTPLGDRVFANCQGVLCKWADDHFERATEEEQRAFGGTNHLIADKDTQVNGWSKRGFVPAPTDYQFEVEVGGQLKLSVENHVVDRTGVGAVSIDQLNPGQPPKRLWYCDARPRSISKGEYKRTFEQR